VKSIRRTNGLPVFGNLVAYRRNKVGFLSRLRDREGDVSAFRLGKHDLILITHPDDIHWVEAKNAKNYVKATNLRELVGDGILMSEGEKWRKQRRLIQPTFHQGTILKMLDTMNRRIARHMDAISGEWKRSPDESVELGFGFKKLAFEIVGEALFGSELGSRFAGLRSSMEYINLFLTRRFGQMLPVPMGLPLPSHLRFRRAKRTIDEAVFEILRIKKTAVDAGQAHDDLITKIMITRDPETGETMPIDQLRDEATSMLLAGFETTGHLLPWIFHLLSIHSDVQHALQLEIDSVLQGRVPNGDELFRMPLLNDVVDETLRLYPPVWAWTKRALGSDTIRGHSIEPGSILYVSPYVVHRHPQWWDRPDEFVPSRWTPELREKNRNAYFPFGMGPRTCVGKHFALMEVKLILIRFFQKFSVEPVQGFEVKPDFQITLGMKQPIRLRLKERGK
jgi:cytochrome P450